MASSATETGSSGYGVTTTVKEAEMAATRFEPNWVLLVVDSFALDAKAALEVW